jgi:hypothetical protein
MAVTYQIPKAAAESEGGGDASGPGNNTTGTVVYPYAVPASLFPDPANLSSSSGVAAVAAIPFPGASSSYAVVNASVLGNGSDPSATVWFSVASYSPEDATVIETNGSCGPDCGDLPLTWSNLSEVGSFPSAVTSLRIAAVGSAVVVGVSAGGATYLYDWSSSAQAWVPFGPPLSGPLEAMTTDPAEVVVATVVSSEVEVTTLTAAGTILGTVLLGPASPGAGGVLSAALALIPEGATFEEVVVFSANGSNELDVATSTDGVDFSTPAPIGGFQPWPGPSLETSIGETMLQSQGGLPGQVALTAAGSELALLYTTYSDGQVVPVTEASGDGGTSWQGPYLAGPVNGTTLNPVLTTGPAGLVYAAWEDPDYGQGTVEEATYEPDGLPVTPPEPVPEPAGNDTVPAGPPTVAVDAFSRPLLLWPAMAPGLPGAIAYTGGYLSANASLNLTQTVLGQSLGSWDFTSPSSPSGLASFLTIASETIATINASLASGDLCEAQNLTALELYANLTHTPLAVGDGSGTVCAPRLDPDLSESPLLGASGLEVPNTYLAVYLDWALEAEGVPVDISPLGALTTFSPYTATVPAATLPQAKSTSTTVDGETETVGLTPQPYSPTAYELSVADTVPEWVSRANIPVRCENGENLDYRVVDTTTVTTTWENVSLNNGTAHSFTGTDAYPSVWVYDLPTYQVYTWQANFTAQTTEMQSIYDACTGTTSTDNLTPGFPSLPELKLDGTFATTLAVVPGASFVTAAFNNSGTGAKLTVQFNTTLPSTVQGSLSSVTGSQTWSTSSEAIDGAYTVPTYSGVNQLYTVDVTSTSRTGNATSPGPSSSSFAYSPYGLSSAEQASASCAFTLTSAVPTISISSAAGAPYTSLNASTVNVTWNSSADALGYFAYYEVGTPLNWTISGIAPVEAANGNWVYSLELHGLEPMVAYNGTFGVSWDEGCLVEEDQLVAGGFTTAEDPGFDTDPTLPYVWEQDLPYDSVTGDGGGFDLGWDTPSNASLGAGSHVLLGGYVRISGSGSHDVVPFVPAQVQTNVPNPKAVSSGTNLLNLTYSGVALGSNQRYSFTVVANYTFTKTVKKEPVTSSESASRAGTFVYQASTSDDGLTNLEKENGWTVPLSPSSIHDGAELPACENASAGSATAQACQSDPSALVLANPAAYATNGLVSDLVEKEFGLDPNTIDTAGSHMLDTWNLTFDLGPATSSTTTKLLNSLGSFFRFYYENGSYNFSRACQSFESGQGSCSFTPPTKEPTNLTCTAGIACHNQKWVGDSSPWASTVLWSSKNLNAFEALITREDVGWLRAVTGTYGKERTITVWGKLSWGANPLTSSTSHDGLPDGDQIDPLGPVVLQFNLTFWEDNNVVSDGGASAAPYLSVQSPGGTLYYSDYGPCGGPSVACPLSSGYSVNPPYNYAIWWWGGSTISVPIVSSNQSVDWTIQMFDNDSSSGPPFLIAALTNASQPWDSADLEDFGRPVAVDADLWNDTTISVWPVPVGSVALNYTVLPEPAKANTLLVTPANETTLSSEPWGLKRYVGEPDFDLLVVNLTNASGPLTVSGVSNAEGTGTYAVTLQPGLNNLLVPRSIFLTSPLGQALLNDTNLSFGSTGGVTFDGAYWAARALNTSNNGPGDPNFIWVFAPSNLSENNASVSPAALGGVPGDPALEAGVASREVQSVLWANLSATPGSPYVLGGAAELSDLIGGLVLNSTGTLSCDLLNITGALPTLDLPANVLSVLANYTAPNNGSYAPPQFDPEAVQPVESFTQFLQDVWNTLSGVASAIVSGIESIVSVVWSVGTAAQAYVAGAVSGALTRASHGLTELASQTAQTLKDVEKTMEWALEQLLALLKEAVDAAFSPIVEPVRAALASWGDSLDASLYPAWADANASEPVPPSLVVAFWTAIDGPLELIAGLAIAVEAARILTTPFDLEGSFVIPILGTALGFGLGFLPGMPSISSLGASSLQVLQTFLTGLDPVPSIYLGNSLYGALAALVVGSAATAGILAFGLLKTLLTDAAKNQDSGLEALAWVIMVMAVFGALADVVSLVVHSAPLLLVAIYLDLVSAGVASYLLGISSGSPVTVSLGDFVAAALLCGGGSAALDILELESQ